MPSRTISTAAEVILPENALRKSFVIQNGDASIDMFLKEERGAGLTVTSTDHDHRISGGGSLSVSTGEDGSRAVTSRWTIIAASGTPRVSFFETEDVRR